MSAFTPTCTQKYKKNFYLLPARVYDLNNFFLT